MRYLHPDLTVKSRLCLLHIWPVCVFNNMFSSFVWFLNRPVLNADVMLIIITFSETGRPLVQDLKSEVSGDYRKTLLLLAEVGSVNGLL